MVDKAVSRTPRPLPRTLLINRRWFLYVRPHSHHTALYRYAEFVRSRLLYMLRMHMVPLVCVGFVCTQSESLHREAYNAVFREFDVDYCWSPEYYDGLQNKVRFFKPCGTLEGFCMRNCSLIFCIGARVHVARHDRQKYHPFPPTRYKLSTPYTIMLFYELLRARCQVPGIVNTYT